MYPLLNITAGGDKLSAPGNEPFEPVPVSGTVCAPVERLIVRVPVRVPTAVGEKVTVTVQLLPAAREALQVVVSVKSPVTATPLLETEVLPVLAFVTT